MRTKRIAMAGGAVIVLLAVLAVAALSLIDLNQYRGRVEVLLREQLNRQVTVGRIAASFWPLGVRVEQVTIGESPSFVTGRPFASVQELYVRPRLLALVRGAFELDTVELRAPVIELAQNPDGVWNFATLGQTDAPSSSSSPPVLGKLAITGGRIGVTKLGGPAGPVRAVYTNIDVQLKNFGPKRPFDLALAITLPGSGAQRVSLTGRAGPLQPDAISSTPFEGVAELEQASIAGTQKFLDLAALEGTDAIVSGKANVVNGNGRASVRGALTLSDTRVRGVAIGYPIVVDLDVAHAFNTGVATLEKVDLKLGSTPLSLTGTINVQQDPSTVDLRLVAPDTALNDVARLASAFGVAFGKDMKVEGRASADVRARGVLPTPALDGFVRLRGVSISGGGVPQPVRSDAIDLTLSPGEVRANDFTITSSGTSLLLGAIVKEYTSQRPLIDGHVRTNGADLGQVLNIARAWGAGAADGTTGSGTLTVDVRASGPLDALTYAGKGSLANATITSPSLSQPLRVANAAASFTGDALTLDSLTAGIGKTNVTGRASVRRLTAPVVDFEMAADRLDVRELQALVVPAPAGKANTAKPSAAPDSDSLLLRTTGTGRLKVGAMTSDQLVLENVETTVALDRGVMRLNPLTAKLFGGRHRGSVTVDARQATTSMAIASTLEQVDANQLLSAVTSVKDVLFGNLGADLKMTLAGDTAAAITRSLNGTMALNLADGRLANINLKQEIGNIARFIGGQAAAERTTRLAKLTGSFDIKSGVARTDNLTAAIDGGALTAAGTIDLEDQSLNMRTTAVLSSDTAQKVGGSSVGGFMTTALANERGELVVPMIVTGTAANPRFAPDAQKFAEMKVKSLVPGLGGGAAGKALGDLVGAVTGKPAAPAAEGKAPDAKPSDTGRQIEGALRGLLGGRKKDTKPADGKPDK